MSRKALMCNNQIVIINITCIHPQAMDELRRLAGQEHVSFNNSV
jgi:hypothetical protein